MPKRFDGSEGRRSPLNLRTTAELRARIERSAADSGRTITQEVEYRIEKAYDADEVVGGREASEVFHNLGKFLKIFPVKAFSEESYLSRIALKEAFSIFVDKSLSTETGGMMSKEWSKDFAPEDPKRIEGVKALAEQLARAVLTSSMLEEFAVQHKTRGGDAPRLGETIVDYANRVDLWGRLRASIEKSSAVSIEPATNRSDVKKVRKQSKQ